VVPDVGPRNVDTVAAAGKKTSRDAEDVLDVIDRLSQPASDERHHSDVDDDDDVFPL